MKAILDFVKDYIWLIIAILFIAVTTYSSMQSDKKKEQEQKALEQLQESISPEQAEQINVWLFDQPELAGRIDEASKDGKITNEEYNQLEDAYRALLAGEKIPRVIR